MPVAQFRQKLVNARPRLSIFPTQFRQVQRVEQRRARCHDRSDQRR
jgi:hypothetical protein